MNRQHLLKQFQKEKNSKINFAVLNRNFHNLVIGIVSAILTFFFTHSYTEYIIQKIKERKKSAEYESIELRSADSSGTK